MASASVLHSEDQFLCSICLDVFTDPVSTSCGHNYCKTCITRLWDSTDVCKCPLCNKTFHKRPEVYVNKVLSEMADQFRQSLQLKRNSSTKQEHARQGEVSCDFCTETKLKALKSCLECQISYCETHLEPHQRLTALKRHKLINPVKNLEFLMCKKHGRPLDLFCKTDHMCVCQFCTELDHKSHQIVSLDEECEGKKAEVQQMIQERQQKIQEVKYSVELSKADADREIADSVQVFTTLISCIERSQAELIDAIEEKQKTTEKQAEDFSKELEQEITELKKRSSELKQLSQTEDLLQYFTSINTPPPTKDWTKVKVQRSSYMGTVRTAVAQLEKTLSTEMEKRLCNVEMRRVQQYAVDVTLEPDTANPWPILSKDGKQVNVGDLWENLQDNKDRFSKCVFVLGKQSFSSGRFYYEVLVKEKTDWVLGVATESINRKGTVYLSPDDGYWSIYLRNGNEYRAAADTVVLLPERESPESVCGL